MPATCPMRRSTEGCHGHIGQSQTSQQLRENGRIVGLVTVEARDETVQRGTDAPVLGVDRVGRFTAPLEGTAEVLDDQPATRPQRLYQSDQVITALRQMAQNQPRMDEIVASSRITSVVMSWRATSS